MPDLVVYFKFFFRWKEYNLNKYFCFHQFDELNNFTCAKHKPI